MAPPTQNTDYIRLPGKVGPRWASFANLKNMGARSYKTTQIWTADGTGPQDGDEYQWQHVCYPILVTIQVVDVLPVSPDPDVEYMVAPVTWNQAAATAFSLEYANILLAHGLLCDRKPRPATEGTGWTLLVNMAVGKATDGNPWSTPVQWPNNYSGGYSQSSQPQVVSGAPRGEAPGLLSQIGTIPVHAGENPFPNLEAMRGGLVVWKQFRW